MKNYANNTKAMTVLIVLLMSLPLHAKMEDFKDGPVIFGFGKHASVASSTVTKDTSLKVAFDVGSAAEVGQINRRFDSLARFINMNVAAGVAKENIQLALVVHGKASLDLLNDANYQKAHKINNPNAPLIHKLLDNNVSVILCGQTASAYEISLEQLVNGSEIELSAMTAHALLQQRGYSLNPF